MTRPERRGGERQACRGGGAEHNLDKGAQDQPEKLGPARLRGHQTSEHGSTSHAHGRPSLPRYHRRLRACPRSRQRQPAGHSLAVVAPSPAHPELCLTAPAPCPSVRLSPIPGLRGCAGAWKLPRSNEPALLGAASGASSAQPGGAQNLRSTTLSSHIRRIPPTLGGAAHAARRAGTGTRAPSTSWRRPAVKFRNLATGRGRGSPVSPPPGPRAASLCGSLRPVRRAFGSLRGTIGPRGRGPDQPAVLRQSLAEGW